MNPSPDEPYTTEQLTDIARTLGIGEDIKHESIRRIVGIARTFDSQQRFPSLVKARAAAALKASKLEERLIKIYRKHPELGSARGASLRAKFQNYLHEKNKGNRGRKQPNHAVTALIQLDAIWHEFNGNNRVGKEAFIGAALHPLGYNIDSRAFDSHRKEALAILNRKN